MPPHDTVTIWINQLKEGERAPVARLMERYFQRLVQLARARLPTQTGLAGYDEDVALSALNSLCLGAEQGRFPKLDDRDDLWRLLALITIRKAIDLQRRNSSRAITEAEVADLLSREPTPDLAAELAEQCRGLLNRLGDQRLEEVALLKVEGHSNHEIAERLGCGLRSVERKLHRIRVLWEEASSA